MSPQLGNILYIEDDYDIQAIAQVALETIGGFHLTLCDTGEQAVQLISGWRPDLLLIDVVLPGMDGPATARALGEQPNGFSVPFIFVTARVLPTEIARLRAFGALGIIAKPFDPLTLADDVRRLWEKACHGAN